MHKATTATCRRCYATLRNARTVARGYGDHCWRMKRREDAEREAAHENAILAAVNIIDVTAFKDPANARDKATQLILDGGIVPTRHHGQYLATGSDGIQTYLVDTVERSCTCKAGARLGRCNHLVAADASDLMTETRPAPVLTLAA